MRGWSARARVMARLVVVACLIVLGGVWLSPAASATSAARPTTITMRMVPRGPVTVDSLIDLYATVTPASAVGNVVFSINGPGGGPCTPSCRAVPSMSVRPDSSRRVPG